MCKTLKLAQHNQTNDLSKAIENKVNSENDNTAKNYVTYRFLLKTEKRSVFACFLSNKPFFVGL